MGREKEVLLELSVSQSLNRGVIKTRRNTSPPSVLVFVCVCRKRRETLRNSSIIVCQVHSLIPLAIKRVSLDANRLRFESRCGIDSRSLCVALLGVQKEDGVHFGGKVMKCPGDASALFPFLWI
jgi:hypothetical protein